MTLTEQELLRISAEHGTINDFGKTFFTDFEMVEFAESILDADKKKFNAIRNAEMKEMEKYGTEW